MMRIRSARNGSSEFDVERVREEVSSADTESDEVP